LSSSAIKRNRLKAYNRQNGLCYWCGKKMLHPSENGKKGINKKIACTAEHLIDKSAGGTVHHTNIVAACGGCNNHRAQFTIGNQNDKDKHYNHKKSKEERIRRKQIGAVMGAKLGRMTQEDRDNWMREHNFTVPDRKPAEGLE